MSAPIPPAASSVDLSTLLFDTSQLTTKELEEEGRAAYLAFCTGPAEAGSIRTHDGFPVTIFPADFDHACFKAATKSRRGYAKDKIDELRVQRLRWIAPVVGGLVDKTECWRVRDWVSGRKPPPEKRLYIVGPAQYVVWLIPRGAGDSFKFKTAYVANAKDIGRYIQRQTRIWSR